MQARAIEEKARFVTDAQGQPIEVIVPYHVYKELLRLKIGQEIYERPETQQAMHRAKEDVSEGRTRRFQKAAEALRWLDE